MKRIEQTTATNCFSACVAMILGISIEDVPTACDGDSWDWDAFQKWLAKYELTALEIYLERGRVLYPANKTPCILVGKSPREECKSGQHAVVGYYTGYNFEILHDPHSSQKGIVGEPKCVTFILSIAPSLKNISALEKRIKELELEILSLTYDSCMFDKGKY